MNVKRVKLEGLHVRARPLLAVVDRALVDSHQGAGGQPQLVVVLEGDRVQERVPAIGVRVGSHGSSALAPLAAAPGVRADLVVEAEDVLLQHVALVEGLVAEVAAVLANPGGVVFVVLEVNVQLLLFDEQLGAAANL